MLISLHWFLCCYSHYHEYVDGSIHFCVITNNSSEDEKRSCTRGTVNQFAELFVWHHYRLLLRMMFSHIDSLLIKCAFFISYSIVMNYNCIKVISLMLLWKIIWCILDGWCWKLKDDVQFVVAMSPLLSLLLLLFQIQQEAPPPFEEEECHNENGRSHKNFSS